MSKNKTVSPFQAISVALATLIMYFFIGVVLMSTGGITMFIYTLTATSQFQVIQLWQFILMATIDLALISALARFVFKSKLPDILKAIYLALPLIYFNTALEIGFLGMMMASNPTTVIAIQTGLIGLQGVIAVLLIRKLSLPGLYYVPVITVLAIKLLSPMLLL